MTFADELKCVLTAIKTNGGSAGGDPTIDSAFSQGLVDPRKIQQASALTELLQTVFGYFYAQSTTVFDTVKASLWSDIAKCVGSDPNTVPSTFTAGTQIQEVLP